MAMERSRRQRKAARIRNRRILREHRRDTVFLHSEKLASLGGAASVWGFWGCPRCGHVLLSLRRKGE